MQRWRIGVQRELLRNLAVEIAYTGSYADRVGRNINEVYVPEQYYSSVTNVRDATQQALLQQQVPNPFNISNFASLATTNPVLYARMAGNAFFTAATVQRQTLLRGYPQLTGLTYANLPLGVVKDHALEITVNRRYSAGLSANLAFAARRVTRTGRSKPTIASRRCGRRARTRGRGVSAAARSTSCRSASPSRS